MQNPRNILTLSRCVKIEMPVRAIGPIAGCLANHLKECLTRLHIDRHPGEAGDHKRLVNAGSEPACRISKTVTKDKRIPGIDQVDMVHLIRLIELVQKGMRYKEFHQIVRGDLLVIQIIDQRRIGFGFVVTGICYFFEAQIALACSVIRPVIVRIHRIVCEDSIDGYAASRGFPAKESAADLLGGIVQVMLSRAIIPLRKIKVGIVIDLDPAVAIKKWRTGSEALQDQEGIEVTAPKIG